jgi:FkbM family methyltransferase
MQIIFRILRLIELYSAKFQGKGYGAVSISKEVDCIIKTLGSSPKIAIDIGGNVGDYTAELLRRNPTVSVHVFEPSKFNVKKLKERFHAYPLIYVQPFAIGEKNENANLHYDYEGSGLASLTKRNLDHFGINFERNEPIEVVRFEDYWINSLNRQVLDLVKLDIEGHELAALRGLGEAIRHIRVLQFEFGGCNIDSRTFFQDFWYFFANKNFDLFRITPLGLCKVTLYEEIDEFFNTTNFLAVQRNL